MEGELQAMVLPVSAAANLQELYDQEEDEDLLHEAWQAEHYHAGAAYLGEHQRALARAQHNAPLHPPEAPPPDAPASPPAARMAEMSIEIPPATSTPAAASIGGRIRGELFCERSRGRHADRNRPHFLAAGQHSARVAALVAVP